MYYLQKQEVYSQGVFWIGESLSEGIQEAIIHANRGIDDYHDWHVVKYEYESSSDEIKTYVVYNYNKSMC